VTKDPPIKRWIFKKWKEPVILVSSFLIISVIAFTILIPSWVTVIGLLLALVVWILILYFFRDPDRIAVDQPGLVVGPCDGKVVAIDQIMEERYLNIETIRISIFLSLFDVHVQRMPLAGEVTLVDHHTGKFLQAFRPEASDVNEYLAMQIKTPFGNLLVKQIAGILARRCINYAQSGDYLRTGQRFGHIKFGSRVDLFIPSQGRLQINLGDKVYGGLTPIALLPTQYDE